MAADLEQSVFPAHAGMSLILAGLANKTNGFPRSRGDEPRVRAFSYTLLRFSPLTRG